MTTRMLRRRHFDIRHSMSSFDICSKSDIRKFDIRINRFRSADRHPSIPDQPESEADEFAYP